MTLGGELPALPLAFVRAMRSLGSVDADALLAALDSPAAGLRVNTLKTSAQWLRERLPWALDPVPWCRQGFVLDAADARPGLHPLHDAGLYYLQDPSAMAPAEALGVRPGECVLDLAAAPGGKATQLAAALAGDGLLVANEVDEVRARSLIGNLERAGVRNAIVTSSAPVRLARLWAGRFDRVLLDAPCSGEGMFRKSAAARAQWSEGLVRSCSGVQLKLLRAAVELVRPGGVVAYSTCTFEPAENEEVVGRLLDERVDIEVVPAPVPGAASGLAPVPGAARLWPHLVHGDGHTVVRLQRLPGAAPAATPGARRLPGRAREGRVSASEPGAATRAAWRAFAAAALPQEPAARAAMLEHRGRLFAPPPALAKRLDLAGAFVLRAGLYLGDARGARFVPAHALALAAPEGGASAAADGRSAAGEMLDLDPDDPRLARFRAGEPVAASGPDGWLRVAVLGHPLGWGRRSGGSVRSLLPSGLRRPAA